MTSRNNSAAQQLSRVMSLGNWGSNYVNSGLKMISSAVKMANLAYVSTNLTELSRKLCGFHYQDQSIIEEEYFVSPDEGFSSPNHNSIDENIANDQRICNIQTKTPEVPNQESLPDEKVCHNEFLYSQNERKESEKSPQGRKQDDFQEKQIVNHNLNAVNGRENNEQYFSNKDKNPHNRVCKGKPFSRKSLEVSIQLREHRHTHPQKNTETQPPTHTIMSTPRIIHWKKVRWRPWYEESGVMN